MSADAVIGDVFVFQILFVDELNIPINVTNPEIEVYYFDDTGVRIDLASGPLIPATPVETGRYVFPYIVPDTFEDGDVIYGEMSAVYQATAIRYEETVNLKTQGGGGGTVPVCCGLRANFVKGG